jgi:hypothetical protein
MTRQPFPSRDHQDWIHPIKSLSLAAEQLKASTLGGTLAFEMARIEEQRSSWRAALIDNDLIGKHLRELTKNSAYVRIEKELKALQSPAMSIAKQYNDLLGSNSAIKAASEAWKESDHLQMERMRKMFEPMAEIRKRVLGDTSAMQLIMAFTDANSKRSHMKAITDQAWGIGSSAKMLAQHTEASRVQTLKLFENFGVGSSIQSYLKDFEHINKQWKVPNELLGIVGSFKELQDQLGKVALPTIDWGSAVALARALGPEGMQEQLALLGIEPDGSMREHEEQPESGLLSRKRPDPSELLNFLMTILIFLYQEISNHQDKAKTEAFQTQTTATLQVQTQQIQNLTILIEKALVQAAQVPEERFVVRERPATVRSRPEHGSAVEGMLFPNEVLRAIDKDGKWVEVEYYHWLRKEYRTGWVLKKYLERVPTNYTKSAHDPRS